MATHKHRRTLGRRIRSLRERGDWSQEGFALAAEIDRSYYAKVERGEVNVSIDLLAAIAKGLGVPVSELFKWD